MTNEEIRNELSAYADAEYAEFQRRLLPTLAGEEILGVRTPVLRGIAKRIVAEGKREEAIATLTTDTFEEKQLHAFLIDSYRSYDETMAALCAFLPSVDNWATADQMTLPALKKDLPRLARDAERFLSDARPYTVRVGIGLYLRYLSDDAFDESYLARIAKIDREEYYIRMMCAWYRATLLAKQYEATIPYFENNSLPLWVHNKAIAKACESYRVTDEHKKYLRTLKRKEVR